MPRAHGQRVSGAGVPVPTQAQGYRGDRKLYMVRLTFDISPLGDGGFDEDKNQPLTTTTNTCVCHSITNATIQRVWGKKSGGYAGGRGQVTFQKLLSTDCKQIAYPPSLE